MIPARFDALVRSLIGSVSRRDTLAALAVGLAAPLLPRSTVEANRKRGNRHRLRAGDREGRSRGAQLGVEKKKSKKKKKKPSPCISACAGKTCGPDGCGGWCGACAGGQSCQNGNCSPTCAPSCAGGKNCGPDGCGGSCGSCNAAEVCATDQCVPQSTSCSPACTGGQVCQPNGQCLCPPDKPHIAPEVGCSNDCRECCNSRHCTGGKDCVDGFCACTLRHRDCGDGLCRQCCSVEDCISDYGFNPEGALCTAVGNPLGQGRCVCAEGLTMCGGPPFFCVNINSNAHCGTCGNACTNGTACINRSCQIPA